MSAVRPQWAWKAYHRWHLTHCDDGLCGFEGALWQRNGDGWMRVSATGARVTVYKDGRVELRDRHGRI